MTEISPKQRQALEALASGETLYTAALVAGVSVRTLHKWRQQAAFRAALNEFSDQALSEASTQLAGTARDAVQTLREICTDLEAPPATRVSAARAILEASLKVRELLELIDRIEALEAQVRP